MRLAANIDTCFTEAGDDLAARLSAAADAGFDAVEMWMTEGRDVPALAAAATERGVAITSIVAGPRFNLVDLGCHGEFLRTLTTCLDDAVELGCDRVVVSVGTGVPYRSRADQLDTVAELLKKAAPLAAERGIVLILENVNTRVDHPGSLTDYVEDNARIVKEVASPNVALLIDFYHAITMGEDPFALIDEYADLIAYAQIAEVPGRGEPTGIVDWGAILTHLKEAGYTGAVGLELTPSCESAAALEYIQKVAADI